MPARAGGSKKLWWIIGAVIVVLLLGWLVTRGLGGAMMAANGVGMQQHMDGSTTYTDSQGNSATVGGNSMPDNWPSDAPANYAGAAIQYSGNSNPQTGKAGAAVVYSTNASVQAVVDYYKAQLSAKGWTVQGTANAGGATVISAMKDGRTFGLYIVGAGNTTTVTAGIEM